MQVVVFSLGGNICAQWHSGSNAPVLCKVENGTGFSEINGGDGYFISFTTSSFIHLNWQVNSRGNKIEWKYCMPALPASAFGITVCDNNSV